MICCLPKRLVTIPNFGTERNYENPDKFGFSLADEELYAIQATKKIEDATINDLADFAKTGTTKILKIHNPYRDKN
jgi:hypothetical protein